MRQRMRVFCLLWGGLFLLGCTGAQASNQPDHAGSLSGKEKRRGAVGSGTKEEIPPHERYPGYFDRDLPPVLGRPLEGLTFEKLEFDPKKADKISLKNGMTIYLMEDHELPMVSIAVLAGVGAVHVPLGKEGLADLAAAAWRSGGTAKNPGDQLDKDLDDRAASLDVGIGEEASSIRMALMSRDLEWGLSVLADVIANPSFPENKIKLEKIRIQEELRRQDDDPGSIAYKLLDEHFYGTDNVWGRSPSVKTVEEITRKDLLEFHASSYHPSRMRMVISGDFNKSEVVPLLEKAFSSWKPKKKPLPQVLPPKSPEKIKLIYVPMPLPQTTFLLAVPSAGRKSPEQIALSVFNDILGGSGFDSLLMEEIRSNRGLAYGVASDLNVAGDEAGMLTIAGQTKAESTVQAISLALQILEDLRNGKRISEADVERAKRSTLNSYVFRFVSPFAIALQDATYDLFGFPENYLSDLPEKIQGLKPVELIGAAQKHIDTTKMVLIVVGDDRRFDQPLSRLGLGKPVEIPPPNRGLFLRP